MGPVVLEESLQQNVAKKVLIKSIVGAKVVPSSSMVRCERDGNSSLEKCWIYCIVLFLIS